MAVSRRTFITSAAGGAAPLVVPDLAVAKAVRTATPTPRPERVLSLFSHLPGTVAVKIYAPPALGTR